MANIKEFLQSQAQKRSAELEELAKRLTELAKVGEESENEEELKAANAEVDELKAKIAEKEAELEELKAQLAEIDKPAEETAPVDGAQRNKLNFMKKEERGANKMTIEERNAQAQKFADSGKMTMETRALLVSSGKLATPTEVNGIEDNFNQVSSIVDLVKVVNCSGMSANKVAYKKAGLSAATKTEGAAANESNADFGFVTIQPTSKAVITYISDQVQKQTPLDYEGKVKSSAMDGLRSAAAEIITNKIKESTLLSKVNATVASGKGVIDEKTLRKIAMNYGGAENVMGNAVLFLNKLDLIAFGDVRGSNEKKAVYEITPDASNPNTGIIKDGGLSVKYCINSNCTALSGTAATTADQITMLYGQPHSVELDLFGNYEVKVSEDYKFAENMLSIRGQVDLGADVIKDGGMLAVVLPKTGA